MWLVVVQLNIIYNMHGIIVYIIIAVTEYRYRISIIGEGVTA